MTAEREDPRRHPGPAAGKRETGSLERGTVVGRYVVLHRVAIGGMGVIYAAYDPELDRKVALKLLRPEREGAGARSRLLREAQALGRLSHPNVLSVHDVGTFGDQVFLALEFVEGESLAAWLRRTESAWPEILQIFLDAGRGLAAAHRAGLVHRDFKPDNVLLGDDGRTRVLDFGTARTSAPGGAGLDLGLQTPEGPEGFAGSPSPSPSPLSPSPLSPSPLSSPVTEEGALVGTLPYMAPELPRDPAHADARSDQFSFCVALYEAVYGEHPFAEAGDSPLHLIDRMLQGRLKPAPRRSRVPGWLREALVRGLSVDPEDRHPSMEALLADLERSPGRGRGILAAAAVLVALGLGVLWLQGDPRALAAAQACEASGSDVSQVWNEQMQGEIAAAFGATGSAFASAAWRGVDATLSQFVSQWREQHADACRATHLRGQQSAELLDQRMLCLDRRLSELRALTDLFRDPDFQVVEEAVAAAQSLPSPEQCGDVEALLGTPRPPRDPEARRALAAAQEELARAQALAAAGKHEEALGPAGRAAEQARALERPRLLGEALALTGEMHRWLGNESEGANVLVEALWAAEAGEDDRTAALAASQLVWLLGVDQKLFRRAHYWVRMGEAKLDRAVGDRDLLRADLLDAEGVLLRVEGRLEESLDRHRRALTLRRSSPEHSELHWAKTADYLAATLGSMGRHQEALVQLEGALDVRRRDLGPEHPLLAGTHNNLGIQLRNLGRLEGALEHQQRAREIFEVALGPSHRFTIFALNNLGNTLKDLGRPAEAAEQLGQALSTVQGSAGEGEPDPSLLSLTLVNLAGVHQQEGEHGMAIPLLQKALELDREALGERHPYVAEDLHELALSLLQAGRAEEAVPRLEEALSIREEAGGDPAKLAATRLLLARALERSGGALDRARQLARSARDHYLGEAEHFADELEQAEAWLRDHG